MRRLIGILLIQILEKEVDYDYVWGFKNNRLTTTKIMKKGLLILLCLPMLTLAQQTYVPDDNFEQKLINLGYDNVLNNYVATTNINTVTSLNINSLSISDLTGIEDFIALTYLGCYSNQLTSLDVSANTALILLYCEDNQLTSLDVSNASALSLLNCSYNQLTSLDISTNTALYTLDCHYNQLTSLDVRNGNNTNFSFFNSTSNPFLYCVNVDDVAWSIANWKVAKGNIDAQQYFSTNCQ